jgi:glycosyltransferase involved in cell wall biosynthesis
MRILLWHGYLLRGSGSNIFKANIVRAWRADGHDVLLLCQERDVEGLGFIDAHGDFAPDNLSYTAAPTNEPAADGSATLVRPAIGEILPVYVYDDYEGFTAKCYVDLTDDELNSYVDRNTTALITAIEAFHPDVIITSHEVMGPSIALRASTATGTTYTAQLHGSALEYAVKAQDRYRRAAEEGLGGATRVIGGSQYMVREASSVIPGWEVRAAVVNPGCDVELFQPLERTPGAPVVGYVGKFIPQKGVHHFLAALGLLRIEQLKAVVVGFGDLDGPLRALWAAMVSGDAPTMRTIAREGALTQLSEFLNSGAVDIEYFTRAAHIDLVFTGRLDHGPLSAVLPEMDVLVVPSILAEAFGMVAAEAAACGVLPVVPLHSGIAEVGIALEDALERPGLLVFDPNHPVEDIAARVEEILTIPFDERRALAAVATEVARERWSWVTVSRQLLNAALAAG